MSSTGTYSPRKPTTGQLSYIRLLAEQTGTTFTYPKTFNQARRLIDAMKKRKRTPRSEVQRERRAVSQDMATHRGDAAQVRPDELSGYGSSAAWTTDAGEEPGPRVVHCKRQRYDVLIDRTTKWGNPFRIGRDGTREECVEKYERWLPTQPHLMAALHELRGKVLGCWCAPEPCHGDPLVRLANTPLPSAPTPAIQTKGEPHILAGYRVGGERRLIVVQRIHGTIRVGDVPGNGKGRRHLVADHLRTFGELNDLLVDYSGQVAKLGSPAAIDASVIDHLHELMT